MELKLYKHQQEAVDILKTKNKYLLAFFPGAGKTLITLHTWYHFYDNNLFVVCPGLVKKEWEKEALKNYPDAKVVFLESSKQAQKILNEELKNPTKKTIFLVSYSLIWRIIFNFNKFSKNHFIWVLDESHKIKNRGSKQSKALININNFFDTTWLLTGTPISIGYEDLYAQMKILKFQEKEYNFWKHFQDKYLVMRTMHTMGGRRFEKIEDYKNEDKLTEDLYKKSFFLDVGDTNLEMPEATEKIILIPENKKIKQILRDKVYESWMLKNSGARFMAHRTITSGFVYGKDHIPHIIEEIEKKKYFQELLETLTTKNIKTLKINKVLVFLQFEQEKQDVKEVAKVLKLKVSEIAKNKIDMSGDIIIAQYQVASSGLNLQADCNTIIYYSPTVSGIELMQSKKRIHRIGQTKPCFYYHLITEKSIEQAIINKTSRNESFTKEMFEDYEIENGIILMKEEKND